MQSGHRPDGPPPDSPGGQRLVRDVITAPAKLTLSLAMTGLRADGFHLIDAQMVTLSFGDELILTPGDGIVTVDATRAGRDGTMPVMPDVPTGPTNLVNRALALAGRHAHVEVRKSIPPGAGLGGGSADAAAILRWAGYTDLSAAGALGADIPFCMVGGRARVTGIGEVVEPLPFEPQTITLMTPPFGCNTAQVYRAWDDLGGPTGEFGNDLEAAALAVEPRLATYRDRLAEISRSRPRLAGSGSTWFVEGAFGEDGCVVCHTIP